MKFAPIMVEGFQELDAQLAAIGATLATEAADEAVLASAKLLQVAWTQGAPYREGERRKYWTLASGAAKSAVYGHLRTNIRSPQGRCPQGDGSVVYAVTTGDAFWGYFLEFGTVDMAPHPWARPIVERMRGELVTVQIDVLNRKIDEAIGSVPEVRAGARQMEGTA
jgi:HK97 gp10 family phage protein